MLADCTSCGCGSGLRAQRCCLLDFATLSPPGSAQYLVPVIDQMGVAFQRNSMDTAEQLSLGILELVPGQASALDVLRRIRAAQGRSEAAEVLLRRFVRLFPNEVEQTRDLALLLLRKGDDRGAETHARNAVRLAPLDAEAHHVLAIVLTETHRPHLGEFHYRRALDSAGGRRDAVLLANLAWSLKQQGKFAEARALYQESVAAAPDIVQTWLGWSRLEEADRDLRSAGELLDRAEAIAPGYPGVALTRAVLRGRMQDHRGAVDLLEEITRDGGGTPNDLSELGHQLDRLGRHADAFASWEAAKQRLRAESGRAYRGAEASGLSARLRNFFTARRLGIIPRASVRDDMAQPIFILGFPRSGTTLVEQVLSAHPLVSAGDELPFMGEIAQELQARFASPFAYPDALSELWIADRRDGLSTLRDEYLERVRRLGILPSGATRFTDKMPLNEMHLGLIALMFPAAPLVHVLRHPLDVVLSAFGTHLTHGFDCALDVESIARHYVLVIELVEHYRAEMALRYLPLRYEDLIDDPEVTIRRLLTFLDLPFDGQCLSFHENRRPARIPSYAQVMQPLQTSSRCRYRRYREQLAPVLPILAPVVERLGYSVE